MLHVKKLIILGGPPAVGKSHFIEEVQKGGASEICTQLNLQDSPRMIFARAQTLRNIDEPTVDTLILHYDFLGPFINQQHEYDDAEALQIINSADEVTFVTLWVPPAILADRIYKRRVRESIAFLPKLLLGKEGFVQQIRKLRRFKSIQDFYEDPPKLRKQYDRWLTFCEKYPSKAHYIFFNVANKEHLMPLSQWNETVSHQHEYQLAGAA